MTTYPNQKMIVTHIEEVKIYTEEELAEGAVQKPYVKIHTEPMSEAMRELSGSAFLVYMYFVAYEDGDSLSPQHIADCIGLSKRSVYNAFNELEKHGYLDRKECVFYESKKEKGE